MRAGVISDTHGRLETAVKILNKIKSPDLVLHAGDFYRDGRLLAEILNVPVHAVAGNCDWERNGPEEEVLVLEGKKVFLTHGHLYQVHFSLQKLLYRALELRVDVVVFGHTHDRYCQVHEGILFFNPGSVYAPRGKHGPGGGLLIIEGGEVSSSFL
ncbi:hypothetical protein SAMN02745218_00978 [Desulfofundulus australicus DSM 11792]|uniref:Phosphoesterase n=1 Tax=Desulfofundulus australicus DSM 11792 TaxID=1121425 RepID=A0A1M4X3Q8_9FIRM|nr:metallophosphoesterase [Desulfofundulus australicus]SHE87993.1 hypothetical protein SAMN02745218_00978 [Desulfofundulus australicus DSM 11792]